MPDPNPPTVMVSLPSCGPAGAEPLLAFLGARAIPGLESFTEGRFRRHLPGGWLELAVPADPDAHHLDLRYSLPLPSDPSGGGAGPVEALVRRVADLDTDLGPVAQTLAAADDELAARIATVGLSRRPGTFDPFELAVRAVVGQQVSVAAARTLLVRLLALVDPVPSGEAPVRRTFPSAEMVARASLDTLGMPARRRATITGLARAVADGRLDLGTDVEPEPLRRQLVALPGIGPWTAGYIALRVTGDGDGWPTGDLVLRQSLGVSAPELERRAARWRPWRSYAALLLWRTAPPPAPRRPAPGRSAPGRPTR